METQSIQTRPATPLTSSCKTLPELVPGITRVKTGIVNLYFLESAATRSWVIVDAGMQRSFSKILEAARAQFGNQKPAAIFLTHGHFDHVGALAELAGHWDLPIYAHPMEFPYLTGSSAYPPPDPTVDGGMMARLSFLFPNRPIDVSERLAPLPKDGTVPGMPEWKWIATPGHSPGHVSFFRAADRALIAGDAVVTTKQESALAVLTQHQRVYGPPKYFTCNWDAAKRSVELLASLDPLLIATGHGTPMHWERANSQLHLLARNFDRNTRPSTGRYATTPANVDQHGVIDLPPSRAHRLFVPTAFGIGLAAGWLFGPRSNFANRTRFKRFRRR